LRRVARIEQVRREEDNKFAEEKRARSQRNDRHGKLSGLVNRPSTILSTAEVSDQLKAKERKEESITEAALRRALVEIEILKEEKLALQADRDAEKIRADNFEKRLHYQAPMRAPGSDGDERLAFGRDLSSGALLTRSGSRSGDSLSSLGEKKKELKPRILALFDAVDEDKSQFAPRRALMKRVAKMTLEHNDSGLEDFVSFVEALPKKARSFSYSLSVIPISIEEILVCESFILTEP